MMLSGFSNLSTNLCRKFAVCTSSRICLQDTLRDRKIKEMPIF